MSNAATIAAVATRRELSDQALVIALAAALQESKLRNLDDLGHRNDHDSLGLFQQRPSQGWGTEEEILDPRLSSNRFFTALLKVDGWEEMRVTDAAQRVQRSAYPEAYEKWADEARVLTASLRGRQAGSMTCSTQTSVPAANAAEKLSLDFGPTGPQVVSADQQLTIAVKDEHTGWQMAHWLVAKSHVTGVTTVRYGDQEWSAANGKWSASGSMADKVTAEVQPAR